jgi:hypothetical protein
MELLVYTLLFWQRVTRHGGQASKGFRKYGTSRSA